MPTEPQQTDIVSEARELVRNKPAPLYVIPNPNWKNAYVRLSHNANAEWTSFGYIATVTNEYAQLFARAPELLRQLADEVERLRGYEAEARSQAPRCLTCGAVIASHCTKCMRDWES